MQNSIKFYHTYPHDIVHDHIATHGFVFYALISTDWFYITSCDTSTAFSIGRNTHHPHLKLQAQSLCLSLSPPPLSLFVVLILCALIYFTNSLLYLCVELKVLLRGENVDWLVICLFDIKSMQVRYISFHYFHWI